MKKILLMITLLSTFLWSNSQNVDEYKKFQTIEEGAVDKFKHLDNKVSDVSKYSELTKQKKEKDLAIEKIDKSVITNTPEYQELKSVYNQMMNGEFKSTVFFYLYSESMPIQNIIRFAQHMTNIQKKEPYAKGYVVFRGLSGVENTLEKLKKEVESPFYDYSSIAQNIIIKLDPRFFQKVQAKHVPITILAECTNKHIFDNCEFKYSQRGALSLVNFLNDVNFVDPDGYGKYYNYVISPD